MAKNKQLRIILIGPQGSGKGTQADLLAQKYGLIKIMPGELFRKNIREETPLGLEVKGYLDKGQLAPDHITNRMMKEAVERAGDKGFIFDGYPRNEIQLQEMLKFTKPTHVFLIKISDEVAVNRIAGRRICPCGEDFNTYTKPPKVDELCDKCGSKLTQRHDDHPDAVRKRLEIYHHDTEPLLDYFRKEGILFEINGEQEREKVFEEIERYL